MSKKTEKQALTTLEEVKAANPNIKIHEVTFYADGDEDNTEHKIYLKRPSYQTLKAVVAIEEKGDQLEGLKVALKNMHLGGTPLDEFINDEYALLSINSVMTAILYPTPGKLRTV